MEYWSFGVLECWQERKPEFQLLVFVILSEAKNLMDLGTYTLEILRLAPQNDVVGEAAGAYQRGVSSVEVR